MTPAETDKMRKQIADDHPRKLASLLRGENWPRWAAACPRSYRSYLEAMSEVERMKTQHGMTEPVASVMRAAIVNAYVAGTDRVAEELEGRSDRR